MVPFWIPIIIRHLIFRVPKKIKKEGYIRYRGLGSRLGSLAMQPSKSQLLLHIDGPHTVLSPLKGNPRHFDPLHDSRGLRRILGVWGFRALGSSWAVVF